MPTPMEKGDALHNAVRSIEEFILRTSPSLKEKTFVFEDKKIVCVGGVHHEIDIFVTIDPAPGYSSIHIFECKNWEKSVGKNEIVAFSEKIDAVNAAHGYFVAKSFTRDAEAQAKKDTRMTLLAASEHNDPTTIPIPRDFHTIAAEAEQVEVNFTKRGAESKTPEPFDIDCAKLVVGGTTAAIKDYLLPWVDETKDRDLLTFASGRLPAGRYEREARSARKFEAGQLLLNDNDIKSIEMLVRYHVDLFRPPIISSFSVETRGRVYSLAPIKLPKGGTMTMRLVERL